MTNEKAKEILDFLAKKIGCNSINMYHANDIYAKTTLYLRSHSGSISLFECIDDESSNVHFEFIYVNKASTYEKILETIINISSHGHKIKTFCGKTFMKPYASLEQILVEMDLEANGSR